MELIPDETALSCPKYPSADFDKLIEDTILQRATLPSQRRILRVTSKRRKIAQSRQESGVPQDLHVSLHASSRSTIRSASTDLWSTSGFVEDEPVMDRSGDELEDSDSLVEPKLESPDGGLQMDDLQEASSMSTPMSGDSKPENRARRPRGRPRKHPVPTSVVVTTKVQKGRSKTGCITCRRRKKKCDETKPSCLNCEKNAVICEGYLDKRFWKSGKEKGEEAQRRRFSVPCIPNHTLAPIIHGVVTVSDRIFLQHYCFRLSVVLTVERPRKNAFKDMLLPMAIQHLGLMHSVLALSSSNLDYDDPYGRALLAEHPDVNVEIMKKRAQYHHDEAMKEFHADIERQNEGIIASESALCVRYGQMLCFVVQAIAKGTPTGEHRIHLQAYQKLAQESHHDEGPFMQFIEEYFQFHIGLDDIISLPPGSLRLGAIGDDWNLPAVIQPEAVRLLGVQDGLFFLMSKITSIRNTIRANMEQGIDPVVDYTSLYRAAEIDAGIRAWHPSWPEGDSRELAGTLYKQMMWVYLWRTIYPPKTTTWQPEYKITAVVNQGIEILEMFPPESQVQTLLLSPTFIIGCAAFDPAQRGPIRKSIANIKAYTLLKNTDLALEVLEQVWKYMDDKDERSWDWQSVAHAMGRDFLAT